MFKGSRFASVHGLPRYMIFRKTVPNADPIMFKTIQKKAYELSSSRLISNPRSQSVSGPRLYEVGADILKWRDVTFNN